MILPPDEPFPPPPPDAFPEAHLGAPLGPTPAERFRARILDQVLRSASWALMAGLDVLPQGTDGDVARWAYAWGVAAGLGGTVSEPTLTPASLEAYQAGLRAGRYIRTGRPA